MPDISLVQHRIAYALKCVNQLQHASNYGNYVSYVKAFPAAILNNGLGQALATLLAKAKGDLNDPHQILYGHVSQWICDDSANMPYPGADHLMNALKTGSQEQYVRAQAEALFLLEWLKKFAGAFLEEGRNP